MRKAIVDLDFILKLKEGDTNPHAVDYVVKEKDRVQDLIDINYKREQETYAKMFNPKTSITDFIKKTSKGMDNLKFKSSEEKEFEKELEKIED